MIAQSTGMSKPCAYSDVRKSSWRSTVSRLYRRFTMLVTMKANLAALQLSFETDRPHRGKPGLEWERSNMTRARGTQQPIRRGPPVAQ
jgi:hypothetical protein